MDKVHVAHESSSIKGVEKRTLICIRTYIRVIYKGIFSFIYPLRFVNFIIISSL